MQVAKWLCAAVIAWGCAAFPVIAEDNAELRLYLDADFSVDSSAGEAIALGLSAALAEGGGQLGGFPARVVRHDHHGNPKRALLTYRRFVQDESALAIIGGMQSPPYLANSDYLLDNGIPVLLPWSAAGPVTRMERDGRNPFFRVSVDDTKSAPFLVAQAMSRGCEGVGLLLIDTAWGQSSRAGLKRALAEHGKADAPAVMIIRHAGPAAAALVAKTIVGTGVDCVILVADATAAAEVLRAIHGVLETSGGLGRFTVLSHWGILSPTFAERVPERMRAALNLQVLNTCGFAAEARRDPDLLAAFHWADQVGTSLTSLSDLEAPAGFVHGFDLGRVLRAAAAQASVSPQWQASSVARRDLLIAALETLEQPVDGILREYDPPFSRWSDAGNDAHEALGLSDLCMTRFGPDGRLIMAMQ